MAVTASLLLFLPLLLHTVCAANFRVEISSNASYYEIFVNDVSWLTSGDTFVHVNRQRFSTSDGSLKLQNFTQHNGQDSGGTYVRHEATWAAGSAQWITVWKIYETHAVFGQHFPADTVTDTLSSQTVLSSFPSFGVSSYSGGRRGYVSFQGDMCGSATHTGEWDPRSAGIGTGIAGSGPIVVFNEDASQSLVLGSFSNFMVHSQDFIDHTLLYGVLGSVTSIPAGFVIETVVVFSSGINNAMLEYGDLLLTRYGKHRYGYQEDYILTHLGYSTDNGAYYYYQTEPDKNYEDTLLDVKAYADQVGIPYRHVLLDSWWYFKGVNAGVSRWDPMPSVFPSGLEYLYNVTGWVQQLHNRYWAANTSYAKQNGGQWDFLINKEHQIALPQDPAFWDYLFTDKRTTGMYMYEQDWLDDQFDHMPELQQSATLAREWMMNMGEAAARNGVTMQECMSHVRHVMQSVELPAITNARASGDYHPGNTQWNIGTSSILAHAVGIAPSKDNYWSTPVQEGTHYGPDTRESFNRMQSAVSSFSTGPVAPSDKVGSWDPALILRACMSDGTLLQPSVPATAIDAHFIFDAFSSGGVQGEVWSSYTRLPYYKVSYVLAIDVADNYDLPLSALGYDASTTLATFETNTTTSTFVVDAQHPLAIAECGRDNFQLFTLSPVIGGWALLGEPDKWVSVSRQRFSSLVFDEQGLAVVIHGVAGEQVTVGVQLPAGKVIQPHCAVLEDGTVRLVVSATGNSACQPL